MKVGNPFSGKYRGAWLGVCGMLVLALIVGVLLAVQRADIGKETVVADFAEAGGMKTGDTVRVAGVNVGKISKMELVPKCVDPATTKSNGPACVRITMKVENKVHLTSDAAAEIKLFTILGVRYLELRPGDGKQPLQDNKIGYGRTSLPYEVDDGLTSLTGKYDEKTGQYLGGTDAAALGDLVGDLNKQLAQLPPSMKGAVDSLTTLSAIANDRTKQIEQIITDTNTVTEVVNDSTAKLSVLVGQGAQLGQKITRREQLIQGMLDDLATLVKQLRLIGDQNGGTLEPLINNLLTASQGLEKNRDNLRHLLELWPVLTRQLNNAFGDGNYLNITLPMGLFPDGWLCFVKIGAGC